VNMGGNGLRLVKVSYERDAEPRIDEPVDRVASGLVMGVLTAAGATGQLSFVPVMAALIERQSWRAALLVVTFAALAVVSLVVAVLRDYPEDRGVTAYGAPPGRPQDGDPLHRRRESGGTRPGRSGTDQDVLGPGRGLRDLRRHHQRADRHPLRALRPRSRHATDYRRRIVGAGQDRPGPQLCRREPYARSNRRAPSWSPTTAAAWQDCRRSSRPCSTR
jgi:hypothetical protein